MRAELAPCAADERYSRGRRYPEPAPEYRGEYQRDRDRIIHSTAFRRLVYKTQVFVNHEGDLYRTRLTHSLEVSQIGRSVAHALHLNEPLTEAICLAHDLGHTPFGHAGQDELNACMREFGGFEHNLQSLRVVDELEAKYADFPGLNLMFETREGILKHCSTRNARELGDVGERFLKREQPGLEAQLANIADAIAYNNHDVDDGIRSGLLSLEQLCEQPLFAAGLDDVKTRYPELEDRRLIYETIRRMIGTVVTDLIELGIPRLHVVQSRGEQRLLAQLLQTQEPGADAVVDVVIVVSDRVRDVGQLCFEAGLFALEKTLTDVAEFACVTRRAVFEDALAGFEHQVEAGEVRIFRLELVDDTQRLQVVLEAPEFPHAGVELVLSGVSERRVAEIMSEADGLGQRFIELQRVGHRATDLRNLEGVCQARSVQVAFVIDEHLGLVHQPPERRGVDYPVPVPLVLAAVFRGGLRVAPAAAVTLISSAGSKLCPHQSAASRTCCSRASS